MKIKINRKKKKAIRMCDLKDGDCVERDGAIYICYLTDDKKKHLFNLTDRCVCANVNSKFEFKMCDLEIIAKVEE